MKKQIAFILSLLFLAISLIGQPLPVKDPLNDFPAALRKLIEGAVIEQPIVKRLALPNNIELEYAEQGNENGTPVIFLHGFTDSWHSYEYVLRELPPDIHAYVLTQRGHGNSEKPTAGYSPRDFAADVAAFMRKLKIEKAVMVGHSMGATIAQRFALDYPKHLSKLVLIGTFASFPSNDGLKEFQQTVTALKDPVDPAFARGFQESTLAAPIPPVYLDTLVGESLKVPARVWKSVLNGLMPVDYRKELSKIHTPTWIVWGDKDLFCPRKDQDDLLTAIKGSKLSVYEGAGHALHWEQPERFANDLVNFINR